MKMVFLGTPDFAVPTLERLHRDGHMVALAVSQPDRPAGRGLAVRPTPVRAAAERLGIPVWQPEDVNLPDSLERIAAVAPDVIVVAAFGQYLKKKLRELAPRGCLNVHASLLPKLRGAAPISRAIMEGHATAGVTIMKVEARMDAGAMFLREEIPLGPDTTAGDLHDRLAALGAGLMSRTLRMLEEGAIIPAPQDEAAATHAPKILTEERRVDWNGIAEEVDRRIRGLSPSPGAYTFFRGKRIVLLRSVAGAGGGAGSPGTICPAGDAGFEVVAGNGTVRVLEVLPEGKRPMGAEEWLRGAKPSVGERFE